MVMDPVQEWGLLDEAQRHLYHAVMTENFALVTSLGCWHGAQDEEAPSEQSVSVGMSEVGTPKPDPSTKKAQPYEMCDPLSKDLLHLPEHDGMYPDEGLYICGANLFQHQKEQIRDKLSRRDEGQPSFLTNSSIHSAERTLTCSRDGKDFPGSIGLLQQLTPHNAGKPQRDTECGEAFDSRQSDYRCTQCGKAFRQKQILVEHQKIHTGVRPYECSKCGMAFIRKFHLVQHQRIHTGERPFQCSECGKCFRYNSTLISHQRVHTGLSPYECSKCGEFFKYNANFMKHQRKDEGQPSFLTNSSIHSAERTLTCSRDGKDFPGSTGLLQQPAPHSVGKPHKDTECREAFGRRSDYRCAHCGKAFS
ncbi:zinc finger protein 547-like [Physeter macrocephalus]|uniref:Zinc finger protein 547-like n=1 Tax=Physeter macrocephalus TaxID=9755 RepID=A0A9W2W7Q3_PHYMC|nr:zinc finger protein 547-like [Physeter catodon]